jgi:hypothetical protein
MSVAEGLRMTKHWRACFRWKLHPRSATGDTTYGTVEIIRALEDAGIRAYVPITDWDKRTSLFVREAFTYDAEADHYTCPNGAILRLQYHDYINQTDHYQATTANGCFRGAAGDGGTSSARPTGSFFRSLARCYAQSTRSL